MKRLSSHLSWLGPLVVIVLSSLYLAVNDSLVHLGDWVALGLLGIAASTLLATISPAADRWFRRHKTTRKSLEKFGPYLLSFAIVAVALWPVPFELPVSQDHAHHYLNTDVFLDLITSGHLFGWSDRISTGLPFGDVYGTPAYIATAFVRIITLGLVSLETSYSLGVFGIWLVGAWAIVAFVRRLAPESLIAAPALATAGFVFDPGADREGGWVYSMFHAVWPQLFATTIFCWTIIALFRLAEKPTYRRLAVAALVAGFAFWLHPMNSLNLLVLSPLIIGLWLYGREAEVQTSGHWLIVAFAGAAVIGWAWISHIYTGRDAMGRYSAYGIPFDELGIEAWTGLFANSFAGWGLLGLLGLVAAIGARTRFAACIVGAFVAFLLLGSMWPIIAFDLGISESNTSFMWRRFFITAKPFWFALVGVGAAVVARGLQTWLREQFGEVSPKVTGLLAIPFLFVVIGGAYLWIPGPAARPLTAEIAGLDRDLETITEFLQAEAESLPDDRPRRVAYWTKRGDHGDYMLFAFADAGFGYIPNRTPPAQTFQDLWAPNSIETARFAGVTHVVTPGKRSFSGANEVGKSGDFYLYRFTDKRPDVYARVRGKGQATVEEWQPMRRVISLVEVDEKSKLELAFPPYKKWKATLNGDPIELGERRQRGTVMVTVEGLEDGTLVLEFEDTWLERVSFFLALLVILLAVFALGSGRRLPRILGSWGPRSQQAVTIGIGLAVVSGLVVLAIDGSDSQREFWLAGEKHPVELLRVLHRDEPEVFTYEPRPYCVRPFSRRPRAGCHEAPLQPRLRLTRPRGSKYPSCMQIGVPDRGSATVGWSAEDALFKARVELPRGVKARLVAGDEKVDLRDDKPFEHQVDGAFSIEFENTGNTAFPCIEAALLQRPH